MSGHRSVRRSSRRWMLWIWMRILNYGQKSCREEQEMMRKGLERLASQMGKRVDEIWR
ncbi:PREDICTED: PRUPE_8G218200 [Prunus dulcis]|nr:PREDICTED: PRUPE_8G218200 [Prunus dulcis]